MQIAKDVVVTSTSGTLFDIKLFYVYNPKN